MLKCLTCTENWVAVGNYTGSINTLDMRMGEFLHSWKPSDFSPVQVHKGEREREGGRRRRGREEEERGREEEEREEGVMERGGHGVCLCVVPPADKHVE